MKWFISACVLFVLVSALLAGEGDKDKDRPACATLAPSTNDVFVLEGRGITKKLMTDSGLDGWCATGFVYPQTPAISDGGLVVACKRLHVEAYSAAKARRRWRRKLNDTDPTSPTIHGNVLSVSTESCTIYAIDVRNGRRLWSKYLSSHLQTQVSAWEDMFFTTAPGMSAGGKNIPHALVGMSAGKVSWTAPLSTEALCAPVAWDGYLYVSCADGTLSCHDANTGTLRWEKKYDVACAPWVDGENLYVTVPEESEDGKPGEAVVSVTRDDGSLGETILCRPAPRMEDFDGKRKNLGRAYPGHYNSWCYQGSRPCVVDGRIYSTVGRSVECLDAATREVAWSSSYGEAKKDDSFSTTPAATKKKEDDALKKEAEAAKTIDEKTAPFFTSPAVTNNHLYVGTIRGDIYCLDAKTGRQLFSLKIPGPVLRQPAVRCGCLCVVTAGGRLFCVKLGKDFAEDSWYQWGGASSGNAISRLGEEK